MLLQRSVANSVLPPALVRRITTLLDEAHACCDAFTREVQRTDLLGVGCSTAGVLMDVPLGLRRLDNQRQKCLSRLHAVEHTVNSMVSVITMEGVMRLCALNNVEVPTISEELGAADVAAAERRLLLTSPMHGPVLLYEGVKIVVEWETVGSVPLVDVFVKRQKTNDIMEFTGMGQQQFASKVILTDSRGQRAEGIDNGGSLEWVPPASLPAGDYFISVRCSRAGKVVSADSCLLCAQPRKGIGGAPTLAAVSVLRPAALSEHWWPNTAQPQLSFFRDPCLATYRGRLKGWNVKVWRPGETQAVRWAVSGPVEFVTIFLIDGSAEDKPGGEKECIAERVSAGDGELLWTVPEKEGKWFYFEVQSSEDERVVGGSGYVAISKGARDT